MPGTGEKHELGLANHHIANISAVDGLRAYTNVSMNSA